MKNMAVVIKNQQDDIVSTHLVNLDHECMTTRLLIIQARKQNAFVLRCQYRVFYATLSFIQERLSLLTEKAESVPLQKTALQQEHRYT